VFAASVSALSTRRTSCLKKSTTGGVMVESGFAHTGSAPGAGGGLCGLTARRRGWCRGAMRLLVGDNDGVTPGRIRWSCSFLRNALDRMPQPRRSGGRGIARPREFEGDQCNVPARSGSDDGGQQRHDSGRGDES